MVRIRPARLSDASAIADIQVETWRDTYAGLIPDRTLLGLSRTSHIESWRRILRDTQAESITRVAEGPDSRVVGFANAGRSRPTNLSYDGEVYTLYVLPDHQGAGHGRRLLGALFSALWAAGPGRAAALVERDAVREALDGAELAQAAQATWRADQAAWQASEPPEPPSEWTFGRVDVPLLESPTAREARLIEEREARNTREAMVHALAAWRKGKPKRPAREQHAPVAVLREQLAPFEAATAAAELAAEQAVVEVELARDRLAKRAADARRRRASKAAPTWTRPVPQMDGYDEWARQQANGAA